MFNSDWSATWTKEEAEKQLNNFQFRGPGIYFSNGGSILVTAIDRKEKFWGNSINEGEKFRFDVFDGRDVSLLINRLVNAPVREDDR